MTKHLLTLINKLILVLLTLLGFSCVEDQPDEYGMPHADFKVNGTVVDEVTLENIRNIQVVMQDPEMIDIHADTGYTDMNGFYEVKLNDWPDTKTFIVKYLDVDGNVGGEYLPTDTTVIFENPEFVNASGNWYEGETIKTINIKLTAIKNK